MSKSSFLLRAEPGAVDPIRRLSQATKVLAPGAAGTLVRLSENGPVSFDFCVTGITTE